MVIGIKDIFKMTGIIIIAFCAVFVCTLFVNYQIDLKAIEDTVVNEAMRYFFDALVMTGQ